MIRGAITVVLLLTTAGCLSARDAAGPRTASDTAAAPPPSSSDAGLQATPAPDGRHDVTRDFDLHLSPLITKRDVLHQGTECVYVVASTETSADATVLLAWDPQSPYAETVRMRLINQTGVARSVEGSSPLRIAWSGRLADGLGEGRWRVTAYVVASGPSSLLPPPVWDQVAHLNATFLVSRSADVHFEYDPTCAN